MARLLLAAVAAGTLASAAAGGVSVAPTLRISDTTPLTVRGTHFRAGEHVTVVAHAGGRYSKTATASAAGTFLVRFRRAQADRCSGFAVTARGDRGSRASYKTPPYECPPIQPPGP